MAPTIASACDGHLGAPGAVDEQLEDAKENRKAPSETTKKRAAWKPACPSPAPNVQWRFHQKLLVTPTMNARTAATR